MNTNRIIRNSCLLLLTALIWGVAFVAQSEGGDAVGPYTFNCIRSLIGSAVLVPVLLLLEKLGYARRKPVTRQSKRQLWLGGVCCGGALCVASNLQQLGINLGTPAGKAGFLTACYILLVPMLSLFLKKRCSWNIWVGVAITLAGLYLLCIHGSFALQFSDLLLLLCALAFAIHILVIDHFAPLVDGVRMSCIQFLVSGLLTAVPALFLELIPKGLRLWGQSLAAWDAWLPILYAGVLSCGAAYTLQIIGQEGMNSTVASLILSLESVFSVLAGWAILKETLLPREAVGCALIFAAVIFAQLPLGRQKPQN